MAASLAAMVVAVAAHAAADTPLYKQKVAPIADRVTDLLGRMTRQEKVNQSEFSWHSTTQVERAADRCP